MNRGQGEAVLFVDDEAFLKAFAPKALIFSGGPASVSIVILEHETIANAGDHG